MSITHLSRHNHTLTSFPADKRNAKASNQIVCSWNRPQQYRTEQGCPLLCNPKSSDKKEGESMFTNHANTIKVQSQKPVFLHMQEKEKRA